MVWPFGLRFGTDSSFHASLTGAQNRILMLSERVLCFKTPVDLVFAITARYYNFFAYSDALNNSFFPRTIPIWDSLPSSVVSTKTIEEFKAQI